ncbi:MAG: gamma-glutamylcyclotransferase family protein [Desulfobacterales bacterium]
MSETVEAFFYGLYMDSELLKSLGFMPGSVQKAKVDSYVINLFGSVKIVPKVNCVVWGNLIELPKQDLEAMYSFESTKAYSPEIVQVIESNGNTKNVSCYNVVETSGELFNSEYHEKLVQTLIRLGFPTEYISSVKALGSC